jgi:hypothetical protein
MSIAYNTTSVSDGLIICLDAGNPKSYPGSGSQWRNLADSNDIWTASNGAPQWNSAGYFSLNADGAPAYTWNGKPSNYYNFVTGAAQHTVEIICQPSQTVATTLFNFFMADGQRAIMAHLPWVNDYIYYDVSGCCDEGQRINYYMPPAENINVLNRWTFRCRTGVTPNRETFVNGIQRNNSGTNVTRDANWGGTGAVLGGYYQNSNTWFGRIYEYRVYNRALSDDEMVRNARYYNERYGVG